MNVMDDALRQEVSRSAVLECLTYLTNEVDIPEGGMALGDYYEIANAKSPSGSRELSIVWDALRNDPGLGDYRLMDMCDEAGKGSSPFDKNTGALVLRSPQNEYFVCFQGTTSDEWLDNAEGMSRMSSHQQDAALDYFDAMAEKFGWTQGDSINIIGHSKGGNKAQYITMVSRYGYLIDQCYSYDGQGFSPEAIAMMKSNPQYAEQLAKILSIDGDNDYVHVLGETLVSEENTYYLKTTSPEGFDPMNRFHSIGYLFGNGEGDNLYALNGASQRGMLAISVKLISNAIMGMDPEYREIACLTIMNLLQGEASDYASRDVSVTPVEMLKAILLDPQLPIGSLAQFVAALVTNPEAAPLVLEMGGELIRMVFDALGAEGILVVVSALFSSATLVAAEALELFRPYLWTLPAQVIAHLLDVIGKDFIEYLGDLGPLVETVIQKTREFLNGGSKFLFGGGKGEIGKAARAAKPEFWADTDKMDQLANRLMIAHNKLRDVRRDLGRNTLNAIEQSVFLSNDVAHMHNAKKHVECYKKLNDWVRFLQNAASQIENTDRKIAYKLNTRADG